MSASLTRSTANGFRTYGEILRDLSFDIFYGYKADGSLWTDFTLGITIGTPWHQRGALWDVSNFATGFGNQVTFGFVGWYNRRTGHENDAYEGSTAYKAGGWTGFAAQVVIPALGTAEKGAVAGNVITNNVFRWGQGSFKVRGQWMKNTIHFHLGPGKGLMKHHLPFDVKTWAYHAWAKVRGLF